VAEAVAKAVAEKNETIRLRARSLDQMIAFETELLKDNLRLRAENALLLAR
jgi:hypothetical protein